MEENETMDGLKTINFTVTDANKWKNEKFSYIEEEGKTN